MSDSDEEISKYITLVSNDGFSFQISREAAMVSGTLRGMLNTSFQESSTNTIKLHELDSLLLEKVIEYLYYNLKYKEFVDVPEFDIPTEMALELLVAADFLDV
ncbi:DEKNAAC103353 [Brettanomyces naardenensis]|uniref:Elongin-C n=1 Tax=Brettanomyces naardenensis TaxID=13370 RepID=A0A448YNG4_BRENA|nr:DEKNAAC103353 [Brettanomyces naardenensis]